MTTSLESAIVRIRAPNGAVASTGFLVTGHHVLSCARVVNRHTQLAPPRLHQGNEAGMNNILLKEKP
jgi:hypothetical protein